MVYIPREAPGCVCVKKIRYAMRIALIVLLGAFASCFSYAQDCLVSTSARKFMSSSPLLQQETLIESNGRYTASLANGDAVLAQFATCELGLKARYLVAPRDAHDDALLKLIKQFLSRIMPSAEQRTTVLPQLKGLGLNEFKKSIVIKGVNDMHRISFDEQAGPFFQFEIHYEWIPPQH